MKQLILILSILTLLLFAAWACSERSEQSAETVGKEAKGTVATEQAGLLDTEAAKEKAKKVFEELKAKNQSETEETKGSD